VQHSWTCTLRHHLSCRTGSLRLMRCFVSIPTPCLFTVLLRPFPQAAEALRRAKFKFPGRQKVVASRNW
jgi:ribosomal protein L16/L10AE